jgi:hypothetical protein
MKLLNLVEPILQTTDLMNSNHIITNTKLSFDPYVWAFSIILTLFFLSSKKHLVRLAPPLYLQKNNVILGLFYSNHIFYRSLYVF